MHFLIRKQLKKAKRILIKIGTTSIINGENEIDKKQLNNVVNQIIKLEELGKDVILISSGAIATGTKFLNSSSSNLSKHAASTIGQALLMKSYLECFEKYNKNIGQILLTSDCFEKKEYLSNLLNTIKFLLKRKITPIINGNDVLIFENNDKLAALIGRQLNADLLIILSDVDGFYGDSSNNGVIETIKNITAVKHLAKEANRGIGGMETKLEAAKVVKTTVIANGRKPGVLLDITMGKNIGTIIVGDNYVR